jgi:hypothetical protein
MVRVRERERERSLLTIEQMTPLLGDTAAGHSWPSIGGDYYTPTLRLALKHAFQQHTRGTRPLPVRPNQRPALSRVRDPKPIPRPLIQRAGRDHPFPIFSGSPRRDRDLARSISHTNNVCSLATPVQALQQFHSLRLCG